MARIIIADLPVHETIAQEELERIFGAGPTLVRLSVETLEERELLATSLLARHPLLHKHNGQVVGHVHSHKHHLTVAYTPPIVATPTPPPPPVRSQPPDTPPTVSVSLNSAAPKPNDILTATATPSDADGNPVTLTYVWRVNGTVVRTQTTRETTDRLDLSQPGNGEKGNVIVVTVTPNDGIFPGTPAFATATVASYASLIRSTPGLVSYWRLGELTGLTAHDSVGGNDGTIVGGTVSLGTAGALASDADTAANFAGGYVNVPDSPSLSLTGPFTLEAWINTTVSGLSESIIEKYDQPSYNGYALRLENGYLAAYTVATPSSTQGVAGRTLLEASRWYHVAAVYDGATLTIYLNGQIDGRTGTTISPTDGTSSLKIGERGDIPGLPFSGKIDEAAIYNVALSPTQVIEHYAYLTRDAVPVVSVCLSNAAPKPNDILTATATTTDADGDPVRLAFVWTVNGTVVQIHTTSGPTDTLDLGQPGHGIDGDVIAVTVTPDDGLISGQAASATATVTGPAQAAAALRNQGVGFTEIATTLHNSYSSTPVEVARLLLGVGGNAFEVGVALQAVYGYSSLQTGSVLQSLNLDASQIALAMLGAYYCNSGETASVLATLNFSRGVIASALQSTYHNIIIQGNGNVQELFDGKGFLYSLEDGVLSGRVNNVSAPQQFLTGVTRMAVDVDGEVVVLQGPNRYLYYLGAYGPTGYSADGQFALDGVGRRYFLADGNLSVVASSSAAAQQVSTGVIKWTTTGSHCCALTSAGELYDNGTKVRSDIRDIAASADGETLYTLATNGSLLSYAPSSGSSRRVTTDKIGVDDKVHQIAMAPNDDLFVLMENRNLHALWAPANGGGDTIINGLKIQSIALRSDGTLFSLSIEGMLEKRSVSGGWSTVPGNVQSLAADGQGRVYYLSKEGTLFLCSGNDVIQKGGGNNVRMLVAENTGDLFELLRTGVVGHEGSHGIWVGDNEDISALVADKRGNVYALNYLDHHVYQHTATGWVAVGDPGEGVTALVADRLGDVYALNPKDHHVYQRVGTGWGVIGDLVSHLVADNLGTVYSLNVIDHHVYERTGTTWTIVGDNISVLATDQMSTVFALNSLDQRIYQRSGSNWAFSGFSSVTQMGQDVAGEVVALQGSHTYLYITGILGTSHSDTGQSYALDGQGRLFTLQIQGPQAGTVTVSDPAYGSRVVATGATQIGIDGSGNVAALFGQSQYATFDATTDRFSSRLAVTGSMVFNSQGQLISLVGGTLFVSENGSLRAIATDVVQMHLYADDKLLIFQTNGAVSELDRSSLVAIGQQWVEMRVHTSAQEPSKTVDLLFFLGTASVDRGGNHDIYGFNPDSKELLKLRYPGHRSTGESIITATGLGVANSTLYAVNAAHELWSLVLFTFDGSQPEWVQPPSTVARDGSVWFLEWDGSNNMRAYCFRNGSLAPSYLMPFDIATKWLDLGGPDSGLGAPAESAGRGSYLGSDFTWQDFENGVIYDSIAGVYAIKGHADDLNTFWGQFKDRGFETGLGFPISDERDTLDGTGRIQYFRNGAIYSSNQFGGAVAKMGVLQLSPSQAALFSPEYLKFREHFLTLMLWDGMVAKYIEPNLKGYTIHFGDQALHMGFALETFANEALLFKRAGLDPTPAERVIQQLLNGFDQMEQGAAKLFGGGITGYFLRDTVNKIDNRHGIPPSWDIASDFDKPDIEQTKVDTELSQDQALHLFMGWRAVANWSTDRDNVRRAWADCDLVMRFLMNSNWKVTRPDGSAPTATHNQGDFRYFAGFFSEIADQVTVAARAKVGNLPGMRSYFVDPRNTIRIRIDLSTIRWPDGKEYRNAFADGVARIYANFTDLLSAFGVGSVLTIDIPVSVSHSLFLDTLSVLDGAAIATGNVGFNFLLPYLPKSVVDASFSYPRLEETTWWTELYPGGPKVSMTGLKDVWHTETLGELLQNSSIPMSVVLGEVKTGLESIWYDWTGKGSPTQKNLGVHSYAMHLLLTALAFDADPRASVLILTLAPAMNDPWCLLLRSSMLGAPVSDGIVGWAKAIHADAPGLLLGDKSSGEWVSTNRWEWATEYETEWESSGPQIQLGAGGVSDLNSTGYNRLDFLSLEDLLRLQGSL